MGSAATILWVLLVRATAVNAGHAGIYPYHAALCVYVPAGLPSGTLDGFREGGGRMNRVSDPIHSITVYRTPTTTTTTTRR